MVSSFNKRVTNVILKMAKQDRRVGLLSVSAGGVGCDNERIMKTLDRYLGGLADHIGQVDTNHNVKNFRYQLLGGSCC